MGLPSIDEQWHDDGGHDQETWPVKYHRVELLILDDENIGIEQIKDLLRSTRYVAPTIISTQTIEVEFNDEHPLNQLDITKSEIDEYFKKEKQQ